MTEPRRERKIITVFFADLVGFTSTAEQLDPEEVAEILGPYHGRLREELERWGGTVEKFIGDAVVAFFGAPVAHEDDPERAVRAGLAIRDRIADERKLEVRIAINTGEALVNLGARPAAGEGMATGDVVNTTARLQSTAPVNGILVGETTYRATVHTIDYREHPAVDAKGKQAPIPVWEVVEARARFGADLAPPSRIPLIGRERELDTLIDALRRARDQRSTELVTLVGDAGLGKSRLVGELFQALGLGDELVYWRQGRSLPYGEGISYWALGEMVKAHAGVLESDADTVVEAKLARALEGVAIDNPEWVLSHLRRLVGQTSDSSAGSRDEAFAAWRQFLEGLADQHPLVLAFEDIHWADDGLLDFIEHLVDWVKGVPMLVLCTARLELLERRPAWGGGKLNATTMTLAALSSDETARLIAALSDRPLLEAETQSALLERAGGNPLYAEQYVRMLGERDTLEELPESVQGIIAARLDTLPVEEKRLLQEASVVGKVFWLGALGATDQELHPLEQKDLVQRARRSSVDGETEFVFKHVLVRDVAYGQLPRRDRAAKHLRTAEWIESLGRAEDQAEMIAHHYVTAFALRRDIGGDDAELSSRVRVALRDAGDRAATLNAPDQAERYYSDALAFEPDDAGLLLRFGRARYVRDDEPIAPLTAARDALLAADDRAGAVDALIMLADACWRRGRTKEQYEYLDQARDLVADAVETPAQAAVLAQVARYHMLASEVDEGLATGAEALRLAEMLGLDALRASVLNTIGTLRANAGDRGGIDDLSEAIRLSTEQNIPSELVRASNNLVGVHVVLGNFLASRAAEAETLRLAELYGQQTYDPFARATAIANCFLAGEWDDALDRVNAYLGEAAEGRRRYQDGGMYCFRAWIRLSRGDRSGAVDDAERALEHIRAMTDPQVVQTTLFLATGLFFAAGDTARAEELFHEALERARAILPLAWVAIDLHQLAFVAAKFGRGPEVLELLDREEFESPWVRAARAIASGDFARGGDILGNEIGAIGPAAWYRLQSGDPGQVHRALARFRSFGATHFVELAETQLARAAGHHG